MPGDKSKIIINGVVNKKSLRSSALHHCNQTSSLTKNQHKTITITICKTEYRENKSRFFCYDGYKTNSKAKLET